MVYKISIRSLLGITLNTLIDEDSRCTIILIGFFNLSPASLHRFTSSDSLYYNI